VTATDPDGDAVWVSARQISPTSPLLGIATGADGTSLTVSAPSQPICESTTLFTLELRAEDGRAGHLSAPTSLEITVEGTPPLVGDLAGAPLVAHCDAGGAVSSVTASGDLTHVAPAQACATQTITWSQLAGPPAMAGSAQGESISLRAAGASWDELVGRAVRLELVANGPVSSSSAIRDVAIVPDSPFVRAAIAADAPIAPELGAVGISVTLVNESGCAVRGASITAFLDGAYLVPGTLRLDGAAVDAVEPAGSLQVSQLDLPPGVTRVLRFDVRPALVGSISARAVATLGDVPISNEVGMGDRPAIGCGCASASEGLVLWALFAALTAWRRRQMPKEIRRRPASPRRSSTTRSSSKP
jgi:MYXO-CTERM domain-containing protein